MEQGRFRDFLLLVEKVKKYFAQYFRPKLGLFREKVLFVEKVQKVQKREFFLAPMNFAKKFTYIFAICIKFQFFKKIT